ncbi:SAM-dependent methyltransferase [Leptospira ryugenii]|uniref:SAM-dependent methyltransferase n=1 Tax=Leptospira ryugenii TaxID=1917863 RepID=A0A2P2E4I4_9LEPT|nr:class I SAM-dependent methyltransferase [Leptospira ryugenii]GBF51795.1 SAM-dependent methyltransferase [Leptospira ryugenii]
MEQNQILTGALQMFENRLQKLKKEREKWAKREGIQAYRVYEEDIPQVPVILDRYLDDYVLYDKSSLRFQTEEEKEKRFETISDIVRSVFQLSKAQLFLKTRKKQKGKEQYEKLDEDKKALTVTEHSARYLVNLSDYLDTGLFLDHRLTRSWFSKAANSKRVLNLFCYTGSFSVSAALGGASQVTSIDLSKTYLDWAKQNFNLNGIKTEDHSFICTDILQWLVDESRNEARQRYDLIFLDPPTFSNSKKMRQEWDIQAQHRNILLSLLGKFLSPGGEIWFSTNFRKFEMLIPEEEWLSRGYTCLDRSLESIPKDFRNTKIHKLFQIKAI